MKTSTKNLILFIIITVFMLAGVAVQLSWGAAVLAPEPKFTAYDSNGDPLVGGKLYTYRTGTTTPQTTWTDSTKATANTNPIILDSYGQASVWIDSSSYAYRFKLTDSDDVVLWTVDGITDYSSDISSLETDFLIGHTSAGSHKVYKLLSEYDDFPDAISTIGSDNVILVINSAVSLSAGSTVPNNIRLLFVDGRTIDGAVTLTIENPQQIIAHARQKVFGGSITVEFTNTGTIYPDWWTENATPGTTDMTAAIQAAVTSAAGVGTEGQLGQGSTIWLEGIYYISSAVTITGSGVYIHGSGMNATEVVNGGTNTHAFHFAPSDPINDKRLWGGVRDMTITYTGTDPTVATAIYLDQYTHVKIENVHLRDHYIGILIFGEGQVQIDNVYIMQGVNTTSVQTNAAGIKIGRRQICSTCANAVQDAGDSLYYTEPNSVYITNTNIRNITSKYGYMDGIWVDAVDGLYLTNNHIEGGSRSAIYIAPSQDELPLANIVANGNFLDPHVGYGDYGIRYNVQSMSNVYHHTWSNTTIDNADEYDVLMTGTWYNVSFVGGNIRNSDKIGMYFQDGDKLLVSGILFRGNDAGSGTGQNINFTNVTDGVVTGCTFDAGYRGVQVQGTSARCTITGNTFEAQTESAVHQAIWIGAANITSNKAFANNSDVSMTVASASDIELPLEHDVIYISGTTNITSIDTDNETNGYSGFDGRVVTLIFADVLTFTDGNNLKIAGNLATTADDTITLRYYNENWYEVARSAN